MTARSLVDTNVWVYAIDGADPAKQATARAVLAPTPESDVVISAQVLGEFYVTVTRKLAKPVPDDVAARMVDQMRRLPVVDIDAALVADAIAGSQRWGISYWDALILTAARAGGCSEVLSEDLVDGGTYGGVRVRNPFRPTSRVSEARPAFGGEATTWDDAALWDALADYERACHDARMRPNAIHSYWDYARRFLDWRVGTYHPRGTLADDRPVPRAPVSATDLERQASMYGEAVAAAGRARATVQTYHRHAMFFVRWLRGDFEPGGRLR